MSKRILWVFVLGLLLGACAPGAVPLPRGFHWPLVLPDDSAEGSPADKEAEAAIQLVIQRSNFEQEQAIAARDPSAMRASVTSAHYDELARTNAELIDNGIAKVRLDALEWAGITVNGDSATATTVESWTAERADGASAQSRDRNVYGLVKQDGVWKIASDEHPDNVASGAAPTPSGGNPPRNASPGPSRRERGTPLPGGAASDGQLAVTQQSIKDVIQRANAAQEQALASHDPSSMRDTATDDYYAEMVRINEDMADHGVTAIHLVNIEWGVITVNGTTARATAFETWSTTYSNRGTDQARDRNTYRLVRQNGVWKIQANEHPDQAPPPVLPRGTQTQA